MCAFPAGSLGPLDTPSPTLLAQNSVIMSLFAELGVGWPGPFRDLSPSLGTRDYLQSLSEATEPRRISSFPDVGLLGSPLQRIQGDLRALGTGSKVR